MNEVASFIASGILEMYVMGLTSEEETEEVTRMAAAHAAIREEIDQIGKTLEAYAQTHAKAPSANLKPVLLATLDFIERMQQGEPQSNPPELTESSSVADYAEWLKREDIQCPADFENIFVKIIGYTPQTTTAVVWITDTTEPEVHKDEHERFLIVEGTCEIVVGDKVHALGPGDFMSIPLHVPHVARVTSAIPCKAILQRTAA